jgi:nucleoside-diphosphate-sugar epimerase
VDDGIDALMTIIDNKGGVADKRIYNIGNPKNSHSVKELADMMLKIAVSMPEYAVTAKQVKLLDVSADDYYGKGYQDVENRLPSIEHTRKELGWEPKVTMQTALQKLFEFYRNDVSKARALAEDNA